jgi:hypothetical protein
MASNSQRKEAGDTRWASLIVDRYESGEKVRRASLEAAMQVLGIKPGTLVRRGKNPRFDRMAVVAGDA